VRILVPSWISTLPPRSSHGHILKRTLRDGTLRYDVQIRRHGIIRKKTLRTRAAADRWTRHEIWLRFFTRPEDQAALRHLSRLLHELILRSRPYLPRREESDTPRKLAAAGRDLRFLAGYLAAVAAEPVTCELSDDDACLSELAERLAAVVEVAAFEIGEEPGGGAGVTAPALAYRSAWLIADLPPDERPRERLLKSGAAALSDAELLAVLLKNGRLSVSVLDLARELLRECGRLAGLTAGNALLLRRRGVGPVKLASVLAAVELACRMAQARIPDREPLHWLSRRLSSRRRGSSIQKSRTGPIDAI